MRRYTVAVVLSLVASFSYGQEQIVWKCADPDRPFRYVSSEEQKESIGPPPCNEWLEIRAPRLLVVLDMSAKGQYVGANFFLADAAKVGPFAYPLIDGGSPVLTSEVYEKPENYGFRSVSMAEAPAGALVVYDGLGGMLIEARRSDTDVWSKEVLYPSATYNFQLHIADPEIPGVGAPKILVPFENFLE